VLGNDRVAGFVRLSSQPTPISEDIVLDLIARLFQSRDDFWRDDLDVHDPLAS
jgi:hypothetical protein